MINILQILMVLPGLISSVEQMFPQSGSGPDKLAAVLNAISFAIPPDQQAKLMPQIQGYVSMLVGIYNLLQVFKKPVAAGQPSITLPAMPAPMIDPGAPNLGQPTVQQAMAQLAQRPFTQA